MAPSQAMVKLEEEIAELAKARNSAGFCAPVSAVSGIGSLGGGGNSLLRTRLRTEFPVKQGKYREFLRFSPESAHLRPITC